MSQHGQAHITLVTQLTAIPTTVQTVASLQHTNHRFHPGVGLASFLELRRRFFALFLGLLGSRKWDAHCRNDLAQLLLIVRCVEATVKRGRACAPQTAHILRGWLISSRRAA